MASSMPRRFPPSFPVTPPKACAALWYKRRGGDTELCGALAGCPLSRLAATALPKGEPSLASPFGGRWCPVGTVQRLTEPAGESGLALARTERASCQPPHPLPWLSPLRARPPRSLVSFWLRAHKVKGKVEAFLKRKRVRPADVPQKTLISLRSAPGAHVRFSLAQARRSAAAPKRELRAQALGRELPGVQPPRPTSIL